MWTLPDSYDAAALWEGKLEPANDKAVDAILEARGRNDLDDRELDADLAELPDVAIRVPNVWDVCDIAPNDQLRPREACDYYLVRLVCTLRPHRDRQRIEWAEFKITLAADRSGSQALAFDLHPSRETQTIRRSVGLSLSPEIKFHEIGATLGETSRGYQYDELAPLITTYGLQSPAPAWEYTEQKGIRLQGDKVMHLLVQAPQGTPECLASLDLRADVKIARFPVLPTRLLPHSETITAAPLSYKLW